MMKSSDKKFIPVVECVASTCTDGLMECVEAGCVVCVVCEIVVMAGSTERMEMVKSNFFIPDSPHFLDPHTETRLSFHELHVNVFTDNQTKITWQI